MSVFTPAEITYLQSQRLARVATSGPGGQPHVARGSIVMDRSGIIASVVPYAALQPDARPPNHECDSTAA